MPILISEDEEIKSSFEIIFLKDKVENKPNISWISYKLKLHSGSNELIFEKNTKDGAGDYVFGIEPINEIERFIYGIENFLKTEMQTYSFEPLEPSFEITMEKGHKGFSISIWVDAGNVISDHYTWDAFGLRFFTSEEKIVSFLNGLKSEIIDLTKI